MFTGLWGKADKQDLEKQLQKTFCQFHFLVAGLEAAKKLKADQHFLLT